MRPPFEHICYNILLHPHTSRVVSRSLIVNCRSNLFLIHIHYTSSFLLALLIPFASFLSPLFWSLSLDGDYHDVQTTKSMAATDLRLRAVRKKDTFALLYHSYCTDLHPNLDVVRSTTSISYFSKNRENKTRGLIWRIK